MESRHPCGLETSPNRKGDRELNVERRIACSTLSSSADFFFFFRDLFTCSLGEMTTLRHFVWRLYSVSKIQNVLYFLFCSQ